MRWLRNNIGKKAISFVELDRLACPKPCLQLACVSKLTEIDLRHRLMGHIIWHTSSLYPVEGRLGPMQVRP